MLHVAPSVELEYSEYTLTTLFLVCRLTPSPTRNMSSSLTTLVPVLSSPNYQVWSVAMKSFLMSQGQWRVLTRPCPRDITLDKNGVELESDKMPSQESIDENQNKIEEWDNDNQKAVGNIILRLAPQIQGNLRSETMDGAGLLWDHLEKQYGKPGIIATYLEFKAAMDIKINDNEDPTTAIDKMTAHFARCNASGLEVPDHFQAMLIMAKLPSAFNGLAQIFCQKECQIPGCCRYAQDYRSCMGTEKRR